MLSNFEACNWKRVVNNLTQKLGLKLTCGLIETHNQELFTAILKATAPIALWARCHCDHCVKMLIWRTNQKINWERIWRCYGKIHIGLTPDALAQLVPPGQ